MVSTPSTCEHARPVLAVECFHSETDPRWVNSGQRSIADFSGVPIRWQTGLVCFFPRIRPLLDKSSSGLFLASGQCGPGTSSGETVMRHTVEAARRAAVVRNFARTGPLVGSDCAIEIDTNATLGPCEAAAKSMSRDGFFEAACGRTANQSRGPTERVGRREQILDAAERHL